MTNNNENDKILFIKEIKYLLERKIARMEVFMKVIGENGLGNKLKVLLQICFWVGIVFLVLLPFLLKAYGLHLNAAAFVIYPNGTVLLIIVRKFIKLFDSLKNNNPFCDTNVKILKSTAIVSLIGSLIWLVLIFLCLLFFGIFIALYILSELFRMGTEYKKENELTI